MSNHPRCLYENSFSEFLSEPEMTVLGKLCDGYNGNMLTTALDAWKAEIVIMQGVLSRFDEKNGRIIFEYDIPRLGKRIDVVLLYKGIIFCIEFKVGKSQILEADVDQVLDYALDLKNFHRFSRDHVIIPVLVATEYKRFTSMVQRF